MARRARELTDDVTQAPQLQGPGFPLRAASIDVGSNAIRLLAAELADATHYTTLASERAPVRLGHGVFLRGRLVESSVEAALAALGQIAATIRELGIEHVRAVATSAVREAKNGSEFLTRVEEATGLRLEVITGSEEARLIHRAVANRIAMGRQRWVLADLGGGSVEVSLVDGAGILWSESHTMGSVRLLEELASASHEPGRFRRLLEEYTATLRLPSAAGRRKPRGFIATGGNIEALAKLSLPDSGGNGVVRLELEKLRGIIDTLSRLSYNQRVSELGLREDRADVILPAALVYERLCVLAGASVISVPFVGLKEGVLLDLVADLATPSAHLERQEREVTAGALALGRRYLFDDKHARHVAALACSLFDQLRSVHGLPDGARRLLVASGLLHDIGSFISYKKHHKHSQYLISSSEIPGVTPRETLLVACIARYHRKGFPAAHHEPYNRLNGAEQTLVKKLAAILRLADALDREHQQRVQEIRASRDGKDLVLQLSGAGDLLLERWSLQRKADLFESVFSVRVRA